MKMARNLISSSFIHIFFTDSNTALIKRVCPDENTGMFSHLKPALTTATRLFDVVNATFLLFVQFFFSPPSALCNMKESRSACTH